MRLSKVISITGLMGIATFFSFCILLLDWIEGGWERQEVNPMGFEAHSIVSGPLLGIVVPLVADDMARAVKSIKRWPTTCSENTLNRVDLILYFAGEVPLEFDLSLIHI